MIDEKPSKTLQLLEVARATLQRGDVLSARKMVVMAMRSDDAVQALDRLLPKIQEPEISAEDLELSPGQIAKITALAGKIQATQHQKIVTALLGRVERIEAAQAAHKAARVIPTPQKYQGISLKPPKAVQQAAQKGLDLRQKFERGGTDVAAARARDIAQGRQLSVSMIRRMAKFFETHEKGSDVEKGEPDATKIAHLLWGGDAAAKWSKQVVKQLDQADKK